MRLFLAVICAIVAMATVQTQAKASCERNYVVQDLTNYALIELSAHGERVNGVLIYGISPRSVGGMKVIGEDSATFMALLSNGRRLTRVIIDVCRATQIVIAEQDGDLRLIVR